MNVTAPQRRNLLKLFNVAEAARELGMSDQRIYRDIRAAYIQPPEVQLGKRSYFRQSTIDNLSAYYEKVFRREQEKRKN